MHTNDTYFPPELREELAAAIRYAASQERDSAAMQQSCERMDRMREELRRAHGEMNIAVDLIREGRDEE